VDGEAISERLAFAFASQFRTVWAAGAAFNEIPCNSLFAEN
jgi:hypothetical protein